MTDHNYTDQTVDYSNSPSGDIPHGTPAPSLHERASADPSFTGNSESDPAASAAPAPPSQAGHNPGFSRNYMYSDSIPPAPAGRPSGPAASQPPRPPRQPLPPQPPMQPAHGPEERKPETNYISQAYIPPDKKGKSLNPVIVFSVLGGIIFLLTLTVGILLGKLTGGSGDKKAETTKATTEATEVTTEVTTEATTQSTEATTEATEVTTEATTQSTEATTSVSAGSGFVPEEIRDYKAPTGFHEGTIEPVFQLDGKMYQLPCPLSEFTDDGWTISRTEHSTLESKQDDLVIYIQKKGIEIGISMYNSSDAVKNIQECSVSGIYVDSASYEVVVPEGFMLAPCGIDIADSMDELKNKLKNNPKMELYENKEKNYYSVSYDGYESEGSISYHWMDFSDGATSHNITVHWTGAYGF